MSSELFCTILTTRVYTVQGFITNFRFSYKLTNIAGEQMAEFISRVFFLINFFFFICPGRGAHLYVDPIVGPLSCTVRKFNWWRYCLALCDIMFDHFHLFDETLQHIELCNSVISHIQGNTYNTNAWKRNIRLNTFATLLQDPLQEFNVSLHQIKPICKIFLEMNFQIRSIVSLH